MAASNNMNRAERFEDEKRRIIESCFSKKDEDGSVLETYITHLRITEYSSHPTSPPPPQARTPSASKPRVITVAVRKSGRVRVHKTKENANGTFSIGKTWNLDDLSAIESFTGPSVGPDLRQWAGDVGFVVTLGKPYYWQAQTDKEKKFFIASMIKIYGKYTGGRVPSLSNFDQRELDQVLGGAARRGGPGQQTPNKVMPSPARPPASPARPPPPSPGRPPAGRPSLPEATPSQAMNALSSFSGNVGSEYARTPSRSPMPPNGNSSPASSLAPSTNSNRNPRNPDPSLTRLGNINNKSQDSVVNSSRSGDDAFRPRSRGRPNGSNGNSAYTTPDPPPALGPGFVPTPNPASEERPPERKRPPMDPLRPIGSPPDESLVPTPLNPNTRREQPPPLPRSPVAPPPRSAERMSPRKPSLRSQRSEAPSIDELAVKPQAPPLIDTATPLAPLNDAAAENGDSPTIPANGGDTPTDSPMSPPDDESRPGLGPMIRAKKSKNHLAGALWKAASAASVFQPRAGGAGEKLRLAAQNKTGEPDGISAVVPARPKSIEVKPEVPEVPEVKVTVPDAARPSSIQSSSQEKKMEVKKTAEPEPLKEEARQRQVPAGNDLKYMATLGVDPSILDKKTQDFSNWLDHFSWVPGNKMRTRNFEEMKIDIERELNKAQAGGWLARFQEEDERVDGIKKGVDAAIEECEELDNLLTLYSVELSTLQDDIAYIEAQGQGLQVQAANQKLLRKELESLLDTCAITADDLQALSVAPLENAAGVEEIEAALVTLFKAMTKIDPSMGAGEIQTSDSSSEQAIDFNGDYAKMRIVQEKKEMYQNESTSFMRRLVEFMAREFSEAYKETRKALEGALSKKVDPHNHDVGRDMLWKYGPLMLYARDVDLNNWNRIIQLYQDAAHPTYKTEFREALDVWKRNARKPTGEEKELLFTFEQEKKEEGLATTARKLTVKRSQTLARTLRSPLGDGSGNRVERHAATPPDPSRSLPYEVFAGVLDDLLPLVEMEQNFIIDFFHATTLEQLDFPDAVASVRPRDRRGNDLRRHRLMEPDRDLARRVTRSMEVIFVFLDQSLGNLVDWVLSHDPLQGVGVLAAMERKMADISQTNQDFLNSVLQKIHDNLLGKFKKFVEEQIRAIEDKKVKIKKRKGVISFMRIFPLFLSAVENMLVGVDPNLSARRTVDSEYDRLLKSMFDSLKVIARENPSSSVAAAGASADPEDKEALNFHILLIENMNHYIEEVDTHGLEILEEWKEAAHGELNEHMGMYLNAVMRRPLGKLLEHLENIEAQINAGKTPGSIAAQPSNSKTIFNKVLSGYDAREVRKGIEALRKRVEKHFDENPGLAAYVTKACEQYYGEVEGRIGSIITNLYGGDVLFEWPRMEVKNAFR